MFRIKRGFNAVKSTTNRISQIIFLLTLCVPLSIKADGSNAAASAVYLLLLSQEDKRVRYSVRLTAPTRRENGELLALDDIKLYLLRYRTQEPNSQYRFKTLVNRMEVYPVYELSMPFDEGDCETGADRTKATYDFSLATVDSTGIAGEYSAPYTYSFCP